MQRIGIGVGGRGGGERGGIDLVKAIKVGRGWDGDGDGMRSI